MRSCASRIYTHRLLIALAILSLGVAIAAASLIPRELIGHGDGPTGSVPIYNDRYGLRITLLLIGSVVSTALFIWASYRRRSSN